MTANLIHSKMTEQGYANRIYAIEWMANLWRQNGTPQEICERMMRHCTEVVESDFYNEERPKAYGYWENRMEVYFDALFVSKGCVVSYD